ncbi:MAG: hypothetical protein JO155_02445 [Acidimicrobiia bacterium]|nr:hypothetical protein [Acidimicrobiia bacterium]
MAVVRLWLGAALRRRWRLRVALALLLGVVGAVVLTVAAGARATSASYGNFLSRQAIPDDEFLLVLGAAAGWWAARATPASDLRTP